MEDTFLMSYFDDNSLSGSSLYQYFVEKKD